MKMLTYSDVIAPTDSNGDQSGPRFEEIYQLYADSVFRFCLSQVDNLSTAEDLAHDTFLRALRAYDRAPPELTAVRGWLLAIARNLTIDHLRRRARWRRLIAAVRLIPSSGRDLEADFIERSELHRVTRAVQKLGERDRQLIGLRVAAELSYREIGLVLRISEQVAKVATYRALAKLRKEIGNMT